MKRPLLLLTSLFFSAVATATPVTPPRIVGISQIVEHPSLTEIRVSIEATLRKSLQDRVTIRYHNANGDLTLSRQIARQLIGEGAEVLIGISTPSTQDFLATKTPIPIVFSGCNDPIQAGFLSQLEKPDKNITGVILKSPVREQVQLIQQIVPGAKKIGMLHTAGEANSVSVAAEFQREVLALQLVPVVKTVVNSAGVYAGAQALVSEVDAVLLPTDNTVISTLGVVINLCRKYKKPLFASDTDSISKGALAGLGVDHTLLGKETADIVLQLLAGKKPREIPVVIPTGNELHMNRKYEKDYGVTLSETLVKQAKKIYP